MRARSEALLVFAIYCAATAWRLWPLPVGGWTHAPFDTRADVLLVGDFHLITWAMAWDVHALLSHPLALFDANIFHPARSALAYSEHFLGYLPLFAPPYLLTGNPIFAANAVIFVTHPLNGLALWALARRFVGPASAALAGLLFALCGPGLARLARFHLLGVFWMPLALLATERWLERGRWRDAAWLAVALALQMLSSFYLAYALVLLYATALPVALWRWRDRVDRRRLAGLGVAIAAAAAPMLWASLPYLNLRSLGILPSYDGERLSLPAAMTPYFAAEGVLRSLGTEGVGPLGYALGVLALLPAGRALRSERGASAWRLARGARTIGVVAVLVGTAFSFGTRIEVFGTSLWSPYGWVAAVLPGFSTLRVPRRFLVIAHLGFALLAAVGLERLLRHVARRFAWPLAAAAAALVLLLRPSTDAMPQHREPTGASVPAAYRWLADHGEGRVLLEWPRPSIAEAGRRMVFSTYHWLPIVDGYSGYGPAIAHHVARAGADLPSEPALQEVVDLIDVGWLLVHLDQLPDGQRARWLGPLPPGLVPVGRLDGDLLLRVTQPVADDRRARFASTTETLGGVPLGPLGERCPGEIRATVRLLPRAGGPRPSPGVAGETGRPARVEITAEVANHGAVAWPALGFFPRGLVRLHIQPLRAGTRVGEAVLVPLPDDLWPGRTVRVVKRIELAPGPGEPSFEVSLVQGSVSLQRCGVAAVRVALRDGPMRSVGARPSSAGASVARCWTAPRGAG